MSKEGSPGFPRTHFGLTKSLNGFINCRAGFMPPLGRLCRLGPLVKFCRLGPLMRFCRMATATSMGHLQRLDPLRAQFGRGLTTDRVPRLVPEHPLTLLRV